MRYTLLDKNGTELSVAIEADAFKKPIVLDPKTGDPTSYEALGYTLGFSEDNARTPHSEESTKLAQKGVAAAEKRAASVGQTAASIGAETSKGADEAVKALAELEKQARAKAGPMNSATAESGKSKDKE